MKHLGKSDMFGDEYNTTGGNSAEMVANVAPCRGKASFIARRRITLGLATAIAMLGITAGTAAATPVGLPGQLSAAAVWDIGILATQVPPTFHTFSSEPGLDIAVTRQRYGDCQVTANRKLAANERMVPFVLFDSVRVADRQIRDAGLVPKFTGPTGAGAFVVSQAPLGGRIVDVGSTVKMRTRKGPTP